MSKINRIYREIPAVNNCKKNCNKCCGAVPISPEEAENLGISGATITPTADNGTCLYSTDKGCSVYEKRPFLCRIFGASENHRLKCHFGASAKKPLTKKQTERLSDKYRKLCLAKTSCLPFASEDDFKQQMISNIKLAVKSSKK